MTEAGREPALGLEAQAEESVYSKDYWDNVFEQVGRRPMVKAALALLALLYGSAIYAPLIANDRPYVLEAIDYKGYQDARRMLGPVVSSLSELLGKTEEEYTAGLADSATSREYGGAIALELDAFVNRIDVMALYLPEEDVVPLRAVEEKVARAVAASAAGDRAEAQRVAAEAAEEARAIGSSYRPALPDGENATGKQLVPATSYPVFESTTGLEVFFMWMWFLVLTWPLWNRLVNKLWLAGDRERIRRARRRKVAVVLGSSLAASVLWWAVVGGSMVFEAATYKEGLTTGDITPTRVVFPPVSMGFAETHTAERFRPPTWDSYAELDEDGRYVNGPRKAVPDPVTDFLPPPKDIVIRYSEPERNAASRFLLGSDSVGRDLFVRILYGGRISLLVGILSTVLLVGIGVVLGSFAGYFGGWVDVLISRIIEIFQSIPAFFVILTAVAVIPDDQLHPIFAIVIVIALVRWTGVARLVRAEFLRLKEAEFVVAAQALGLPNRRIIFRHVLPNGMGPVLVAAAFSVAAGILTESAISFLGFGVKLPIPSWGSLLSEARGVAEYWWLQIFPGVLIFITVFAYNIVGEGVRDALDPRRKV